MGLVVAVDQTRKQSTQLKNQRRFINLLVVVRTWYSILVRDDPGGHHHNPSTSLVYPQRKKSNMPNKMHTRYSIHIITGIMLIAI